MPKIISKYLNQFNPFLPTGCAVLMPGFPIGVWFFISVLAHQHDQEEIPSCICWSVWFHLLRITNRILFYFLPLPQPFWKQNLAMKLRLLLWNCDFPASASQVLDAPPGFYTVVCLFLDFIQFHLSVHIPLL